MKKWNKVYVQNLPIYMQLIEKYFEYTEIEKRRISVDQLLDKLSFNLPKGLTKKEIKEIGRFPVVSQSKEMIVGYSDFEENVISTDLPLIIYGDHSKSIKFVDFPFVIGADGVKLLKPKKYIDPKYFYFSLIGLETETKNYGRHFSLLKKKFLVIPSSLEVQYKVVRFVEDLKANEISKDKLYFSSQIEKIIESLQSNSLTVLELNDELTHQQTLLKKLRQQILQEAIEGKLTADWRVQNPDVEPASELLKRIAAEKAQLVKEKKIKPQKPLPPITEEEKPFELPQGWEWCRIWDVAQVITSGSRDWAKYYSKDGAIFLTMGNLSKGTYQLRMDTIRYVKPPKNSEGARTRLLENDLLISITGEVGNLGLIPPDFGEAYINQHTCILRFMPECQNKYFPELMRSPLARYQYDVPQRGIKNSFRLSDVGEMIVPIPPAEEQHAIVSKVEKLLDLCDQLETQITQNQSHAEQLMQAVLKEAFSHNSEAEPAAKKSKERADTPEGHCH